MSHLHAFCVVIAFVGTSLFAQAAGDESKPSGGANDDIARLLLQLAPVPLPHPYPIDSITFSRDGKTVTTVSNAEARVFVWEAASGRLVRHWRLPRNYIASSSMDAEAKILALADGASSAEVWDVVAAKRLQVIK